LGVTSGGVAMCEVGRRGSFIEQIFERRVAAPD
jgi:hypothetical protein